MNHELHENLQPWYGDAQLLITLAGQALPDEDHEKIRELVESYLKKKYKKALISVELPFTDGEWGDPSDLS